MRYWPDRDSTATFLSLFDRYLLIAVTLCYMTGLLTGYYGYTWLSPVHIFLAVGFILLLGCCRRSRNGKRIAIALLFLLAGHVNMVRALRPPDDPSHILSLVDKPTEITLGGVVTTMPEYFPEDDRTRFLLASRWLIRRDQEPGDSSRQPATGLVRCSVHGRVAGLTPGNEIMAIMRIDRIRGYQTPGTFDYRRFMMNRGISCSGWIRSPSYIQPVGKANRQGWVDTWRYASERKRQQVAGFFTARFDPVVAGLYRALLIGDRSGLPQQVREQFIASGCMHLLAISGLHVGLLFLMLTGIGTLILKQSEWLLLHTHVPTLSLLFGFPALVAYGWLAGMNVPVLRALLMAFFLVMAVFLRRKHSLPTILAAAALILLVARPLSLFSVSFQLSFGAMLAIGLILPELSPLFFPEAGQRTTRMQSLGRRCMALILVSLIVNLSTLPLLLYHFNRFSLIGPVMNLMIEPLLCFIALPLGFLALPFLATAPAVAETLLRPGALALALADTLTGWGASQPLSQVWTITPTISEAGLYILLLALALLRRDKIRVIALTGLFLLGCWFVSGLIVPVKTGRVARVDFLDVGQGAASLLRLPDGRRVLIDGGGSRSSRFDTGKNVIAPFLWKNRIWRLDTVIITHPDSDHFNGLPFIMKRFRPNQLVINGQGDLPESYRSLLRQAERMKIDLRIPDSGTLVHRDHLCALSCLGMRGLVPDTAGENDQSLVMRLQCGSQAVLFPGDIELMAEEALISNGQDIRSGILLAPHHGSNTSGSDAFIQAVNPFLIVVSASKRNLGRFPSSRHVRAWTAKGIELLVTGVDGTVSVQTDGNRFQVQTFVRAGY